MPGTLQRTQALDLEEEPETSGSSRHANWREKVDPLGFICMFSCIVEHVESYHIWE